MVACVRLCTFGVSPACSHARSDSSALHTSERWIFSNLSLSLGFTGKILREAEKQDSNRRRRGEKEQRVKDSVRVEQVSWWIYRTHCYCQYLSVYTEILFATPVCCSDSLLSLWSLLTAPPQRPTERERETGGGWRSRSLMSDMKNMEGGEQWKRKITLSIFTLFPSLALCLSVSLLQSYFCLWLSVKMPSYPLQHCSRWQIHFSLLY